MEQLELHPINARIVCLNQSHLRPMWIFDSLRRSLGCYYNNHLMQVVCCSVTIQLPVAKSVKLKGHASHPLTSCPPSIKTTIQTGTYLMFHVPNYVRDSLSQCYLILNNVESVTNQNSPTVLLQLIPDSKEIIDNAEIHKSSDSPHNLRSSDLKLDFNKSEKIERLVEDEENIDSDEEDSDSLEDVHKVIRQRLVVNIRDLMDEWKSHNSEFCVLLLKPGNQNQAWQFKSAWMSVISTTSSNKENIDSQKKKTNITRKKPVSSNDCSCILNSKRNLNKSNEKSIQINKDTQVSVF